MENNQKEEQIKYQMRVLKQTREQAIKSIEKAEKRLDKMTEDELFNL